MYLNHFSNPYVFPSLGDILSIISVKHHRQTIILFLVRPMPAPVFVAIFDSREEEHEAEGDGRGVACEHGELRDLVQAKDGEEVEVGEAAELLEEVAGEEGEGGVFAGADLVAGVALAIAFFV